MNGGLYGRNLGNMGDAASHSQIVAALEPNLSEGDAILSEEGTDDLARLAHSRVWIVDPLDGTREFGEFGRSDWAVHVALAINGSPAAGAVSLPALGKTLSTLDPVAPPARFEGPLKLVASRSRAPYVAQLVATKLGGTIEPMGSAGAKAMAVVLGQADAYVHAGGQYEWDSCAPVAVAAAAGLHTSRIDGSPLRYNEPDPYLPDLLICRPEWAEPILEITS